MESFPNNRCYFSSPFNCKNNRYGEIRRSCPFDRSQTFLSQKGIATASREHSWCSVTIENERALNDVMNKALESGGNAKKIIDSSSSGDPLNGGGITYIVGVYNS